MEKREMGVFPTGNPNDVYAKYFVGQSYLNMLSTEQVTVGNVTFEPGCRNNWHIHHAKKGGGQLLLVTAGKGCYQEWGKEPVPLYPGDVVHIPPEVKHWHGATPDSWFQHLAIEVPGEECSNEWCEAVSDEEYAACEAVCADKAEVAEETCAPPVAEHSGKNRENTAFAYRCEFSDTDPEITGRFNHFAFQEVANSSDLDGHTRMLTILAALAGCQGTDEFCALLPAALDMGVTPVEVKELLYQAVAYLGIGRVRPFLQAVNEAFTRRGIALPLRGQAGTTLENRLEKGSQAQVDVFGEGMRDFWKSGPEETRHINRWLAENCFGDYYTRTGLDYRQREMITFCFLAAQGGCEPQLASHIAANIRLGNDQVFLIKVISQWVPFIGYPRCLNALRCVNETAGE